MRRILVISQLFIFALANLISTDEPAITDDEDVIGQLNDSPTSISPSTYQQPQGCPERCECDDNLSSTVCSRRNLTAIPLVPVTSLYAYFDRNTFVNPRLAAQNFTTIPYVRGLYLRGCGITHFEADTFQGLKFLRELDLSYNKISFVPRGSFANLQLEFLDLGSNPAIRLMPDSFCGAAISRLSLKCCDLENVNVQTFHPLFDSITSLTLSCNDLETVPAALVWSPSHLATLNIADNPRLTCDCDMVWIARRQTLQKQVFKADFIPKSCSGDSAQAGIVNGTCSTDTVMLKDVDYGLCVRSLEAMRKESFVVVPTRPPTHSAEEFRGGIQKKPRSKAQARTTTSSTTTPATTTTLSTIVWSAVWPVNYNDRPTASVLTPTKTFEYSVGEDVWVESIREVAPAKQHQTAVVVDVSSRCGSNRNDVTTTAWSSLDCADTDEEPQQYTRANMFAAVLASAVFTFVSILLCLCANRICSGWLREHRREMKRRNDWDNKACSICSSSHENNATATRQTAAPSERSLLGSNSTSSTKCSSSSKYNPTQHHCVTANNAEAVTLKQSVSYPSGDLTKQPPGVVIGNPITAATNNKPTLHVRMAVA